MVRHDVEPFLAEVPRRMVGETEPASRGTQETVFCCNFGPISVATSRSLAAILPLPGVGAGGRWLLQWSAPEIEK